MNTNKNLLGTLFLVLGTVACTFGAYAANSANEEYNYTLVNTDGAKGEGEAQENLYKAYYCTKVQAGTFFGGADTYQAVTTFLTANMANYTSGMDALAKASDLSLGYYDFDEGVYSFFRDNFPSGLAAGNYLAIVAYTSAADEAENIVRVFSSTAVYEAGLGTTLLFDDVEAGDWTTVNVPEPTSGMLLLLGSALLALRRKSK